MAEPQAGSVMGEARRFLRYVTPGTVFLVELSIYLIFSLRPCEQQWNTVLQVFERLNISTPLMLLFVSAGIGFLLSTFHHALYWCSLSRWLYGTDYRGMIKHAENERWLLWKVQHTVQFPRKRRSQPRLSQAGAWRVATYLIHCPAMLCDNDASMKGRLQNLSDIMHGAGTALTGSLLAMGLAACVSTFVAEPPRALAPWIWLPAVVLLIRLRNYISSLHHHKGVAEMFLLGKLRQRWESNGNKPSTIIVGEHDLDDTPDC